MLFIKFSFLFFIVSSYASEGFSEHLCLNQKVEVGFENGFDPFGLIKNKLKIKKDLCVVEVMKERFFIMKDHWQVDVCREPVHIKEGSNSVDVLRYVEDCSLALESEFCQAREKILNSFQDMALIFAAGEKEDLGSEHGQVYCAYYLIKKYLEEGVVLDRFRQKTEVKVDSVEVSQDEKMPKEKPVKDSIMDSVRQSDFSL